MIIDGHAHAMGEFGDPDLLVKILDKLGVDKVVLCSGGFNSSDRPHVPKIKESRIVKNRHLIMVSNRFLHSLIRFKGEVKESDVGNDLVYSFKQKYPERIIQYFWLDPSQQKDIEKLEQARISWEINGIKLHQCVMRFSNSNLGMSQLVKYAGEHCLPIFIHPYSTKEVKKLIGLAKQYSDTSFTLAHLMGLETFIKFGKELENIYFDISPYHVISEKRIYRAIAKFGVEKILLGSDTPMGENNLENNIHKIRNLNLSKKDKDLILGENIAKLLKIA
jgi:predicted TIM-barrel fold metal-dependent hydrolase